MDNIKCFFCQQFKINEKYLKEKDPNIYGECLLKTNLGIKNNIVSANYICRSFKKED